jgi:hypothetical protein
MDRDQYEGSDNRPGAFDDLLGDVPKVQDGRTNEAKIAELVARATLACAELPDGAPRPARVHLCTRCTVLAQREDEQGRPEPPVRPCESWVAPNGRRYYAGTCGACSDIEWSAIWQLKYDQAEKNKDAREMRRLTDANIRFSKSRGSDGRIRHYYGTRVPNVTGGAG